MISIAYPELPTGQVDIAVEAVEAQAGAEVGREHLDYHRPAEAGLLGHEHAAHGAAAELAAEDVAVAEGGAELVEWVGQGRLPSGGDLG
jgi:hypothetical protein